MIEGKKEWRNKISCEHTNENKKEKDRWNSNEITYIVCDIAIRNAVNVIGTRSVDK